MASVAPFLSTILALTGTEMWEPVPVSYSTLLKMVSFTRAIAGIMRISERCAEDLLIVNSHC